MAGAMFEERGAQLSARDAVCILTHDPKFDVPAVQGALASKVGYIGVMGSRTTHAKRMQRLAEVGVTDPHELDRLMSPIGLDIGARTPEETAISICAEIIARRTGRVTPSLRDGDGPIHQTALVVGAQGCCTTPMASPKRSERVNISRTSTSWPGWGEWITKSSPRYRLMCPG